jgi:Putative phage serine protease XkdF
MSKPILNVNAAGTLPVYRLEINPDMENDMEVDYVALVDRPAIEKSFLAFAEDSWNDYPEAAVNNAKRALKWAEENGWGNCGEQTGKTRANQIANREKLSRDTIARISGFKRHQQHKDVAYSEGCGGLMWDAWGGDAMIDWAERKLRQIERNAFAIQDEDERIITGALMLADTPIYRNDQNGEYYVVFTKETIKQIAQKFFAKGYQSNVNLMHDSGQQMEGITMFESWITDAKRGIKAMAGFEDVPDGSWFGSFKVNNDQVWQMIKEGKVKGFSVEGLFQYKPHEFADQKMDQLWAEITDILSQI